MSEVKRRGLMLVLSSPSGAGKTTISRALLKAEDRLSLSVSATTRPQRSGEVEGNDYFFVTADRFKAMVAEDAFLEHATVFDHCYGTPKAPVEARLAEGKDVLFDIDWQGTQQLAERARDDLVRVFILPPSVKELERRLYARARDPQEVVQARMAKAGDEMSHWFEYDYIVVNRDLEESLAALRAILHAERLKRNRQIGLSDFVRQLQSGEDNSG